MYNRMTLSGPQKDIKDLFKFIKSDRTFFDKESTLFDFERVVPIPPAKEYSKNWYNWNIEHWGTKWNAYDCKHNDNTLIFTTAYTIPYNILIALSEKYKHIFIDVQYQEEVNTDTNGKFTLHNGKLST